MPDPVVIETPAPAAEVVLPQEEKEVVEKTDVVVTDSPADELEMSSITRNEDGNFVFLIDPENPEGTRYEGKTLDELMFNVRKGKVEADNTIERMKKQGFSPKAGKDTTVKGNAPYYGELTPPDDNKIFTEVVKELGVEAKYMQYTKEQWLEHEREFGAVDTMELKQSVRSAHSVFNQRSSEENTVFVNNINLANEVSLAVDTLVENGFTPEQVNLDEVIERVNKNPRYWQEDGVRVPGAIATELTKELTKIASKTSEKKTEKEIAFNGKKSSPTVKVKVTAASEKNHDDKKPATGSRYHTSDALSEIKNAMRASGKM